jgi:hypothetical protein
MTHVLSLHHIWRGIGRFIEHATAVVVGFVMMVVGLALGVTMIMLPAGLIIGLLGVVIFIGGLFARLDDGKT